ncbi:MAG: sigma-70 family RNA polymerase sigma factor, partial [Solirubrobacterales bacterium]|nr:sigma-70 family RNA polymerase sigma factor [Solirubrobacterales bacterium]
MDRRLFLGLTDDELVAQVRAGDDCAFEAIYDRYARGVLAFCVHMLRSREEAEDALQQTFVSAYRALRGGDSGISLRPWLYTIARNRCLSELRGRPDAVCVDGPVEDRSCPDGPADLVQQREQLRELLEDIRRLPYDQRAALVLFELGDHSHTEIASVLGVRREKVKALIFQAREALLRGQRARTSSCTETQELLATVRGKILPRSMTRAHIDRCPSCAAFERQVHRQRAALALILPVPLVAELKPWVLAAAHAGGSGIAAGGGIAGAGGIASGGGIAGGGGIVAAGAGTSGGGAALAGGGAVAGGTAVGGGGAVAASAGAIGGLAGAGTGACGIGVAAAAPAAAVATGLTAGGTMLAVVGGLTRASPTALVSKIVTAVAIATGVVAPSHALSLTTTPPAITSSVFVIQNAPAPAPPAKPSGAKAAATPSSAATSATATTNSVATSTPQTSTTATESGAAGAATSTTAPSAGSAGSNSGASATTCASS